MLWYHHIYGETPPFSFFLSFSVAPPQTLPAPYDVFPASSDTLLVDPDTLHPASVAPFLFGRCPITTKLKISHENEMK